MPEGAEERQRVQQDARECRRTPEGAAGRQKVQLDAGRCSWISKVSRIDLSLKYQVVKILG